jgi:hypothetical protein
VVQRQVLYLGEINSSQAQAWRREVEVFDEEWPRRNARLLPQRSLRNPHRRRCHPPASERNAALPPAPVGRLLAGEHTVTRVAARSVLSRATAKKPERQALGSRAATAGELRAHLAGQRMGAASPMVPRQRDGRSPGIRFSVWWRLANFTPVTTCWSPTGRRCSRI